MPESTGKSADGQAFALRLSVPAHGDLHEIAGEVAAKVAEHLGAGDAQSLAGKVADLAAKLRNGSPQGQDIAMVFRRVEGELVVEARCAGEASEVRHEISA